MELFGSSGTRGVAGSEITPEFVIRVCAAAGHVFAVDRMAVGRDTRRSGPMLADAAASGLASLGVDVHRLGIVPTPGIQAYARREGMPAVIVTASHNPPEYNGIKLVDRDGVEVAVETLERIESLVLDSDSTIDRASWDRVGESTRVEGGREAYIDEVVEGVDKATVADAAFTVALDPGHGAGVLTTPTVLRELGCRVHSVHAQLDGRFPGRDPEPVAATLDDLCRLVVSSEADLGIAHDGDADRAVFVDEDGNFVSGDAILAALAGELLEPGDTTVAAVTVSQRLVDVVDEVGASLELTRVGSTFIVQRIRELQATGERVPIAGEGNGGIYVPPYALRRDGAFLGAILLETLAGRNMTLREFVEPFDEYENVRFDLEYESSAECDAMNAAVEELVHAAKASESAPGEEPTVTRSDGVRIDYGDAWVLARPSGTEPLFRVYAESRESGRASELAGATKDRLIAARESAAS